MLTVTYEALGLAFIILCLFSFAAGFVAGLFRWVWKQRGDR